MHIRQQQALQQEHAKTQPGGGRQQQQQQGRDGGRGGWNKWNRPQAWGQQMPPPVALVLAPTRELAQQTQQEAERLGPQITTA